MFNFRLIFGNKYHKDQLGLEDSQTKSAPVDEEKDSVEACCCSSSKNESTCSKE